MMNDTKQSLLRWATHALLRCDHTIDGKRQHTWDLLDARGIYCGRVCEQCEGVKRAQYDPQIFEGYSQRDMDEPIEEGPV